MQGKVKMRIVFGAIFLILGVFLLESAIAKAPLGEGFQFFLGYYLPSGAFTAFGVLLLAWKKRN
jgi:lipopolysaccharide export LptBFGC system permease protein LptF